MMATDAAVQGARPGDGDAGPIPEPVRRWSRGRVASIPRSLTPQERERFFSREGAPAAR